MALYHSQMWRNVIKHFEHCILLDMFCLKIVINLAQHEDYKMFFCYCLILLAWHRCIISRLVHKIFLPSLGFRYLTSQVVMIQSFQPKGREFESTCFFYLYSIRLISFIIDVPRPLRNEILDHSISKGWWVSRKMSQCIRNIFSDSRENIVPYYSQNIRLKIIYYTCCLSSVGKRLKRIMQQVLAIRQSRFFLISAITIKKICQKHRESISHIERSVKVLDDKNNNNKCKYR